MGKLKENKDLCTRKATIVSLFKGERGCSDWKKKAQEGLLENTSSLFLDLCSGNTAVYITNNLLS